MGGQGCASGVMWKDVGLAGGGVCGCCSGLEREREDVCACGCWPSLLLGESV